MALILRCCIVMALSLFMNSVSSQKTWHKNSYGFELGFPGPSMNYSVVGLSGWYACGERIWLSAGVGYGGKGRLISRSKFDRMYNETLQRYSASVQILYNIHSEPDFIYYAGIGPFASTAKASIGHSFIYDMPEGAMIAHEGADFRYTRGGILTSTGVRFFLGSITMDARMYVPVYYEKSSFGHIQNPQLIVDFKPYQIFDYQQPVEQVTASVAISIGIGIALNKRKWWHVIRDGPED